jgi:hypothetical protein
MTLMRRIAWSSYTTDDLAAFSAFSDHVASARAYFATRKATRPLWLAVQLRRSETLAVSIQGDKRGWGLVLATQCKCFEHCPVLEKVGTELATCSR